MPQALGTRLRTCPAPILEALTFEMPPNLLFHLPQPLVLRLVLGMFDGDIGSDGLMNLQ